ncbi:MAG: hypothetical protein CV045_07400 [Cyanobacteria bacterium M5B4]|nr:MAG: hypothetical protein CV045_07400 [Cyanobacteria bacterium M5B4]
MPGEQLKDYIGYDTDGDGVSDTNLFKKDPIRVDAFYHQGDYNQVNANSAFIEAGVQTRRFRGLPSDKDINEIITQF